MATLKNKQSRSCFICLTDLQLLTVDSKSNGKSKGQRQTVFKKSREIWWKFIKLVSRYVSFASNNPFEMGNSIDVDLVNNGLTETGREENYQCCDACLPTLASFCELYDQTQLMHLELVRILDKITNMMREDLGGEKTQSEDFRENLFKKIEEKRKRAFPRVTAENLHHFSYQPPVSPIIESLDVDTDITEPEVTPDRFGDDSVGDDHDDQCPTAIAKPDNDNDDTEAAASPNQKLTTFKLRNSRKPSTRRRQNLQSPSQKNNVGRNQRQQTQLSCPMCPKSFRTQFKLNMHLLSHSKESPFHCLEPNCFKEFRNQRNLRRHIQMEHPSKNVAAPLISIICEICGKSFAAMSLLKPHIFHVHSGLKPFKCDMEESCTKAFCTRVDLERHKTVHTGQKKFKCKFCAKTFKRSFEVPKHIRKEHRGQGEAEGPPTPKRIKLKKHECDLCGISFSDRKDLKRHRLGVHRDVFEEERKSLLVKFKCNFDASSSCTWAFLTSSDLQRHIRSHHQGERPFKCEHNDCDQTYKRRTDLTRHLMDHLGEKPFLCGTCGQSFKRRDQMRNHEKTVHGQESF